MPLSSFQVEWLLHRMRQRKGALNQAAREKYEVDRVSLTSKDQEQLEGESQGRDSHAHELLNDTWPADLQERSQHPPAVNYEMERRAGSFMRPKYPPFPPPATIPRLTPWKDKE